jgi:hypothetical protein
MRKIGCYSTLLVLGFSSVIRAESIPFSIIDLCNLSDIIVSAEVLEVIPAKTIENYDYSKARLRINSVMKGDLKDPEIFIHYNPYVACPPAPRFNEQSNVIIFVDYLDDRNVYTVFAAGRGLLELSENEVTVYEGKIKKLLHLLDNMEDKPEDIAEWLVSSFENPITRDEAANGLKMGAYRDFYTSEPGGWQTKYDFIKFLDNKQKKRIYDSVIASKPFDYQEYSVIPFCKEFWDQRLTEVMMAHVRTNADSPSYLTFDIISLISDIMELEEGKKIVAEDKALAGDPARWDNRKKLVRRFIELVESSK